MRRILCRWLIGACCVALPIVARAQVPQQLRSAEVLVARIEAAFDDEAEFDLVADRPALDAALATIREYLSTNPADAGALILSVRCGRVRQVLSLAEKLAEEPEAGALEPVTFAAYQRVLDGVLARDSTVAAAHYWKAVLLLDEADIAQVADLLDEAEPPRGPSPALGVAAAAEGHLRQAVAHDPGNVAYREYLALELVDHGAFDAADELLSHPTTAGTGLHLLVRDLRVVGAPPAAQFDEALAGVTLMTGLAFTANTGEPWRARDLLVRVRAWTTSASLAEVQAHYGERWPGLFFDGDEEELWITGALLWRDGGWRAVRDSVELANVEGQEVIYVYLMPPGSLERLLDDGEERGEAAASSGGRRMGVVVVNGRRLSAAAPSPEPAAPPAPETAPASPVADTAYYHAGVDGPGMGMSFKEVARRHNRSWVHVQTDSIASVAGASMWVVCQFVHLTRLRGFRYFTKLREDATGDWMEIGFLTADTGGLSEEFGARSLGYEEGDILDAEFFEPVCGPGARPEPSR